jgi:PDZ domain-containing protein
MSEQPPSRPLPESGHDSFPEFGDAATVQTDDRRAAWSLGVEIDPRTAMLVASGFATMALAALLVLLPVPYAVLSPGPVVNTLGESGGQDLISITGRRSYESDGELDLTTVSVSGGPNGPVSLIGAITGWLDGEQAVVPVEEVFPPGLTREESDALTEQEMVTSQESATAAALAVLDIDVPTTLTISSVESQAPAAAVLRAGDVIVGIAGQDVADTAALRAALDARPAGDEVRVTVRRGGERRDLLARTFAGPDGRTLLGVTLDPTFRFPFDVRIQIDDIGGPSAGMMFALGIIERLTPGDMTGGEHIAGTGTIDDDGSIGAIGGIQQKLIGARRAGATWFLAPAGNCAEVSGHVPDGLRVVRVADLREARRSVEAIATGVGAADLAGCDRAPDRER